MVYSLNKKYILIFLIKQSMCACAENCFFFFRASVHARLCGCVSGILLVVCMCRNLTFLFFYFAGAGGRGICTARVSLEFCLISLFAHNLKKL